MKFNASKSKTWIAALICLLMICAFSVASAKTYMLGDEADEIALAQTALKQLKLYTADITGHFGEKTQTAVKSFQKKYGLANDGVLGEETLSLLFEKTGLKPVDIFSASPASSSASSVSSGSGSLLRYDSSGDAVYKLQQDLHALGYYSGTISGHYGSKTEAAVMNFQRRNNLSADGIAGAKTLAKIASAIGSSASSSSSSASSSSSSSASSSSSSSGSSLLKYGDRSEAVRTMQQNLKDLGYYTGSVTGNFGKLTKDAVADFQRANGLSVDGIAGSKTLSKIASATGGSGASSSSGSSSGSSSNLLNTNVTLQKNSKSDEVRKMQNMLKSLGYYTGNVTGSFGDITAEAVVAFQKAKGLTADGIAGKKTLAAINADYTGNGTGSSSSSTTFIPSSSKAGNVIYDNFYNWRTHYANGEYCTVYDFSTGYSWRLRIMTKDAHMDAEPVTAEDTATMLKAFGNKTTWTPKPVWVTFSDGKTYIGSTHDTPHDTQHITDNNFKGHLCVHFPIAMSKANAIGSYATSHQEAINEGWAKTQAMM